MSPRFAAVSWTSSNGVAVVRLAVPSAADPFDASFSRVLDEISHADIQAILIEGDGPDFCRHGLARSHLDPASREAVQERARALVAFGTYERQPLPVVVALRGRCVGAGLELAARADLVVLSPAATFANTERDAPLVARLGGVLDDGYPRVLPVRDAVAQLSVRYGACVRLVQDDRVEHEALAFARALASAPRLSRARLRTLVRAWNATGAQGAEGRLLDLLSGPFGADARTDGPDATD